ncbi:HEAT repeat domain-containing protein [Mesorhizobium sp. LSJC264A00]|uniref:HEAT repeat domain-containing protein n=1 Tax=unclassified Mesorhizobium TaxID=325217 RepID=UPI0012EBDB72|nr:HEAT repeat domain-containing protein [Mesorhizobium sp. LSJC264A00]
MGTWGFDTSAPPAGDTTSEDKPPVNTCRLFMDLVPRQPGHQSGRGSQFRNAPKRESFALIFSFIALCGRSCRASATSMRLGWCILRGLYSTRVGQPLFAMTDLFEAMRLSAEDSEVAHLFFSEGGKILLPLGKSTNAMTGQEMLERLLSSPHDDDGALANDLLGELGKTVPLESLRLLLTSANAETRAAGAFIATFQNQNISSMVGELAALLGDSNPRTRFDAVESILRCSTRNDGQHLAQALFALDDYHDGVRMGAVKFVRFAKDWQLKLARQHAALLRPQTPFSAIADISGQWRGDASGMIRAMLDHSEPVVRRYGLGLASRARLVVVDAFVEWAQASADPEISKLATDCIEHNQISHHAVWQSSLPAIA